MHDQTSVSHWSASLAFSDSLPWPKRKEEEEDEEEGGGYNREFRDIGRWNDCRSCLLLSREVERRGYVQSITNVGGAVRTGTSKADQILNVNNRLGEEKKRLNVFSS